MDNLQFKTLFFSASQDAKMDLSKSLMRTLNVDDTDSESDTETKPTQPLQQPTPSIVTPSKDGFISVGTAQPKKEPEPEKPKHEPPKDKKTAQLEELFEKYKSVAKKWEQANYLIADIKDEDEEEEEERGDIIKGMGFLTYSQDLGVTDDKDPTLIIIAWKLQVNQPAVWQISRWV